MFFKRYLFLNFFLTCGITFHYSYGLDLKNRKLICDKYVALNKFDGEWIKPLSFGIFDDYLEFEEELEESNSVHSEEMTKIEEDTSETPRSFSRRRVIPKIKSPYSWGLGAILETGSSSIFSLGRNLVIVSAVVVFVFLILHRIFSKGVLILFLLIVSTFWHWMKLYQEKIAEKQNITENLGHPNECRRSDLRWYQVIYLYFSSYVSSQTDCKEYYKAQLVDPFWEVSLPMAMMNAFTSTICEPMKVFATTVRFCCEALFKGLTLLQTSIALFAIFISMLMIYGYSFSFLWGAIALYRPINSADRTISQSLSCWGYVTKYLKALFFRERTVVRSLGLKTLPENKVCVCNKEDKIKVLETSDEFLKHQKGFDNVEQNSSSHPGKKNHKLDTLKISQFRKCHKKSLSC